MDTKSKVYLYLGWILIIFVVLFLFFPLSAYQSGVPFYVNASEPCSTSNGTNCGEILSEWAIIIFFGIGLFLLIAYHYAAKDISLTGDLTNSINSASLLLQPSDYTM